MKTNLSRFAKAAALCAAAVTGGGVQADTTITDFSNFVSDVLADSWADPNTIIVSGPDTYDITATGYGSNYKFIGGDGIMGAGETTLQLSVNLSGPPTGNGHLGPIVDLFDLDGTGYSYRWYGQTYGNKVLTAPVEAPFAVLTAGSTPGLDLNNLQDLVMQLDPGGFGTSGAYTIKWDDLRLTSPPPPDPTLIADFNNSGVAPYASWGAGTLTTGTDSFSVAATNFGGGWAQVSSPLVDGTGQTHIEFDVTVNSGDSPHIVAVLEDGDTTQITYRWFSVEPGNHKLSFRMETVTNANGAEEPIVIDQANSWISQAGSVPGLDLSTLSFFHIQVDPHGAVPYDVSFNNLRMKNIPGGFDTDEDSDGFDFLVWQRRLTPNPLSAADLLEWEANYGQVGEALIGASAAVPEPTAASLLLLGSCATLLFNRRINTM